MFLRSQFGGKNSFINIIRISRVNIVQVNSLFSVLSRFIINAVQAVRRRQGNTFFNRSRHCTLTSTFRSSNSGGRLILGVRIRLESFQLILIRMLRTFIRLRLHTITQDRQHSMSSILSSNQVCRMLVLIIRMFSSTILRLTESKRVVRRHGLTSNFARTSATHIETSLSTRLLNRRMFRSSFLKTNSSNHIGLRSLRTTDLRMLLMRSSILRLFTNNRQGQVSNLLSYNVSGRIVQTNQFLGPHRVMIVRFTSPFGNL